MMKWDKLENFIRDHRDEVDDKLPPEKSWERIEGNIGKSDRFNTLVYWKAAAMIFFVLSAGLILHNVMRSDLNQGNLAVSEFEVTESYYLDVIQNQENVLINYIDKYPNLAKDFRKDLAELSVNYQKLKKEYAETGSAEVLNALIQNLQLQQELLNNQIQVIELIEKKNEDISI